MYGTAAVSEPRQRIGFRNRKLTAFEGGCSSELWLEIAASREQQQHPEDALAVYRAA